MNLRGPRRVETAARSDGDRHTLADLPTGAAAEIAGLDQGAPEDVSRRLRHLGFRAGTQVVKMRTAPLGDPAVYRLLGYDTCLRRNEAAYIRIAERP